MTMRKKLFFLLVAVIVTPSFFIYATSKKQKIEHDPALTLNSDVDKDSVDVDNSSNNIIFGLYTNLGLDNMGLSQQAFNYAIKGYQHLLASGRLHNTDVISIVDFSQPSTQKRLYIIDIKNNKILFNTYVSHGRNSGRVIANSFSNAPESYKSSLGFYVTGQTYMGKHGYSLRLSGEEKGINDNALSRAIVMHGAAYVNEAAIKGQGFIGRSLGCPAIMESLHKPIIQKIKDGSCMFMYSADQYYASHSTILKKIA